MLRSHADGDVRALANRLWDEFGEYCQRYFTFCEKWRSVSAIEEDPEVFLRASKHLPTRHF